LAEARCSNNGTRLAFVGVVMTPRRHKPLTSAQVAGLRYVTDGRPGIGRVRSGKSFRYISPSGRRLTDAATVARIRALAIPPAWTSVWIACDARAHLQATGRDARGRKQYRYHQRWRAVRHEAKYERLVPFARSLAGLRRRLERDLSEASLTKNKVVAAVVELLGRTFIRVGNSEYLRANKSFGLTTLRDRHVRVRGRELRFDFRGKSGVRHFRTFSDARLARIVKRCQELPGQELFQYVDGGKRRVVTSADVNGYLREATGAGFTTKDFRTWAGTLLAAVALRGEPGCGNQRETKGAIVRAIEQVAAHLGNTPAVCRSCYIHPYVLECYADGTLSQKMKASSARLRGLSADEAAVLGLLATRRDWRAQLAESARAA
jgi:DNA topoisomerase I